MRKVAIGGSADYSLAVVSGSVLSLFKAATFFFAALPALQFSE